MRRYLDGMATQERAACWECGTTFDVTPIPPPPTYCPRCRAEPRLVIDLGQLRRDIVIPARPQFVTCRNCGRSVAVKKRGRLPTRCRGGCPRYAGTRVTPAEERPAKVRAARRSVPASPRFVDGPADPWHVPRGPVYLDEVMQGRSEDR